MRTHRSYLDFRNSTELLLLELPLKITAAFHSAPVSDPQSSAPTLIRVVIAPRRLPLLRIHALGCVSSHL